MFTRTRTVLAATAVVEVMLAGSLSGCAASLPAEPEARCNAIVDRAVDELKASGGGAVLYTAQQYRESNCTPDKYASEAEFLERVEEVQAEIEEQFNITF